MSVCYRPPVFIHANTCSDLGHSLPHPASHGLGAQDPSGSTLPPISWGLLLTIPASRATAPEATVPSFNHQLGGWGVIMGK